MCCSQRGELTIRSWQLHVNGLGTRDSCSIVIFSFAVVEGRNLSVMDPTGKSDPYCIVIVGNQEKRTAVQYNTIAPVWHETLQFEVSGVPQLMQNESSETILCSV